MLKERFEIVEIGHQGEETVLNNEFTSYADAIKCAAFAGLPQKAEKMQVRDANTKEWIWELFRKEGH